jgi:anti-sigma regulatory factor (Ser/Thr protein kinase)
VIATTPPAPSAIRLTIDSHWESVALVGLCVRGVATSILSPSRVAEAELCVVEVVNNAIEHGYAGRAGQAVSVTLHLDHAEQSLVVVVSHRGLPPPAGLGGTERLLVDPLDIPLHDLPEGGYGLALLHALACDVSNNWDGAISSLSFRIRAEEG